MTFVLMCISFIRFGRHFELPLLVQSFIMIAAMLVMLQLCTKIKRESDMSAKKRSLLGECRTINRRYTAVVKFSWNMINKNNNNIVKPVLTETVR